VDRTNFCK
jgi:hypothetical protein